MKRRRRGSTRPGSIEVVRFRCATCGEEHEGLPDLAFEAPHHYETLPARGRSTRALLTSDLCVIDDEAFFVRACLAIPIRGSKAEFVWGVWVSLSEKNFRRYVKFFDRDPPAGEGPYFGWFCNQLPGYPETLNLKTEVHLRSGGDRPMVQLEPADHPLAVHQRRGIPLAELIAIVEGHLHPRATRKKR